MAEINNIWKLKCKRNTTNNFWRCLTAAGSRFEYHVYIKYLNFNVIAN